jgi:enoyl-CoA hydratase
MGMTVVDTGTDKLLVEVDKGAARVTLNNPKRMNALSLAMLRGLRSTVGALASDRSVRIIVFAGAGELAFSAGADLRDVADDVGGREQMDEAYRAAIAAVRDVRQPTIAAIQGYCLGGGVSLALSTDIRICDMTASFAIPAARIGIGYPDVEPLLQVVGPGWAAEMLFTGRSLSSSEAAAVGLVNRVVTPEEFGPSVDSLTRTIAENAPLSVMAAKVALRELRRDPSVRDQALVASLVAACAASADLQEGTSAFAERRQPRFEGR